MAEKGLINFLEKISLKFSIEDLRKQMNRDSKNVKIPMKGNSKPPMKAVSKQPPKKIKK